MKCKKCRKETPDESKFCCHCGQPIQKKKMYRRPDGLYERILTIDSKRVAFRGKTEREVERKILDFQGVQERGPLFREVAEQWADEHFPALAYNTLRGYRPALARAIEYFGDKPIRTIIPADVKQYIAQMPVTWAQKTYRNYCLVLGLILKYAAGEGIIPNNPAEYVQPPKGKTRNYRRAPTQQEIDIIKFSLDKPFGLFAYLLLYTGCRRGEALALQYQDVDWKQGVIHITKSVYHDGNAPKIKQPKTTRGTRDVPLLSVLADKIPPGMPNDYIFGGRSPLTASRAEDMWIAYQRATGLEITPHIVRHGYATILHEAGISPKDAQSLLGHANISTTLDTYTHVSAERRMEIAHKLDDFTQSSQRPCKSV